MSEFRQNMLTGEWVAYAVGRQKRPYDFVRKMSPKEENNKNCPFCGGNEELTPWPILQDGKDGEWGVRVFENRFPVVSKDEHNPLNDEFYNCAKGEGCHEILVDTPTHNQTIVSFSKNHLAHVLYNLKQRGLSIMQEPCTKYLQIFKNCGADAGMSLAHSHWQMVGLPIVPRRILAWQERSLEYKAKNNCCMLCHMLEHERAQKKRVIFENADFTAFSPYAGRFPYEAFIVPNEHISSILQLDSKKLDSLAEILLALIKRLSELREDIGCNICFIEEPKDSHKGLLHWHIEIYPRIGGFAGMEFATETYVNTILPEDAAKFYRGET